MQEQDYLTFVLDVLRRKIKEIDVKMAEGEQDIAQMHAYFWENYNEFDEYGYEVYDNSAALKSRMREQKDYTKERSRYEKMLDSPYFGRVDFCYEGEKEPERYYIGIANLSAGRAEDPYVFDWRAPVCGLFYDYDKGPAQFLAPAGIMTGEVTGKKQYKIKCGKLVYVLEHEMNIDDEILQQALLEHADASLKSIVTTIQREQNRIIRDQKHRILAVQGCAGSGKTSVALHRIAYLLYHNRNRLNAAQVFILSPNSIFADYISRILPELGEENIREMTFDDFAYRQLREYGEAEDRYDELEKLLHPGEPYGKPASAHAAYKQTREFIQELDGFVLSLEWEIVDIRDFRYKKMELKETEISKLFYEKLADVPLLGRMEKIGEFVIDAEETLRGRNMDDGEKQEIFSRLEQMYTDKGLLSLYCRFLLETGYKPPDASDGILRYEDVYPLLYLKYALYGCQWRTQAKHLVIDEMQDYTYLQYVLIDKLFHCPMTILGDRGQTMAERQQDALTFLPKIFGKDAHCVYLDKSYRSTEEIMAFAGRISQETSVHAVRRHGDAPQIKPCATKEAMYRELAEDLVKEAQYETLAVLCLDAKRAKEAAEVLSACPGIRQAALLTKDSMKFGRGISVMPFYLAKGLEFDAVFIPDLQEYVTPLHKQALYINVTRALHKLRLYELKKK